MSSQQYLSHDTIHALATPVGGALAIVRVSGPKALAALAALTTGESEKRKPRELFRHKIAIKKGQKREILDDAVCVFFQAPRSHTGEDVVEFFLHGGAVVAERVLESLESLGSRQALPGEFSFRAVRNGKTSLSEAEAVADLIAAKNVGAADLALEKMEGSQSNFVRELAESLRKLSTMGELGIDFADQDVEELSLDTLQKQTREILVKLSQLEGSFDRGEKIQSGVRAAFIGRPNAGKSSFFNALLGEERSIVSETAGTTRDVIRETLTLRGRAGGTSSVTLRIEDTAGIRPETSDQIEKIGIQRSIRAARDADLVLLIVNAGVSTSEWGETLSVWEGVEKPASKTIGILTKIDTVSESVTAKCASDLRALGISTIFGVASPAFSGIREAATGIVEFCERFVGREPGEVLLTRLDHLRAVRETITHLERALGTTAEDLFAADLKQALAALGPVIGETLPDDILGRIFSEFCIGK